MSVHEGAWDEDRGGPRHGHNLLSFPTGGQLYQATAKVWPWSAPGGHEQEDRRVIPSVYIEGLFARAPVPAANQNELKGYPFMVKCLSWADYMDAALALLLQHGLTKSLDEDDDEVERVFEDPDEVYAKAAEIIASVKEEEAIKVQGCASFEWLEGYSARPQDAELKWFYEGLNLCDLTERSGTLELYVDLNFVVGPRSTEATRIEVGGTFHTMVASEGGGQLGHAIKGYYYNHLRGQVVSTAFLCRRLVDFLCDSRWPDIYMHHFERWEEYSFDLPNRALWHTASRQEWATIVQNKIVRTIKQTTPTLHALFHDYEGQPSKMVREIQALGDLLLQGEDTQKLPFYHLERVEKLLAEDHGEMINAERNDEATSEDILKKVVSRIKTTKSGEKMPVAGSDESVSAQAPKPGQMARALGVQAYAQLEVKYITPLQSQHMPVDDVLEMMGTCLTAQTVLPHAVLFATKGMRIAVYIGQTGTDFLALLHSKRHLMRRYIGQSLAFDIVAMAVPTTMKNFEFDEAEFAKLVEFEWDKLDFLNGCFLKLMGAEVGTVFHHVSVQNLYHRGDMLNNIQEVFGRLFECIGYPKEVPSGEGWTFSQFIDQLKRIQKFAIALAPEEQKGAHALIDTYKSRGFVAASLDAKRVIYGPSPADQRLGAFIKSSEPVFSDINETLEALRDTATWRRRMGTICGKATYAATPDGFTSSQTQGQSSGNGSSGPSTSKKQKKGKSVAFAAGTKGDLGHLGMTPSKGKSPEKGGKAGQKGAKAVGKDVERKSIFPYEDGSFSNGTRKEPDWAPEDPREATRRGGERGPAPDTHHPREWMVEWRRGLAHTPYYSPTD